MAAKYVNPRCDRVQHVRKMSGAGGMPSTWFVERKCRLDAGHHTLRGGNLPCDFTRGRRLGALDARFLPPPDEGTEGQDRDGYSDATELDHLRAALKAIIRVCHGHTTGTPVDDLAQCANLADQGLKGQPLVGDPGVYDINDVVDDEGNALAHEVTALLKGQK